MLNKISSWQPMARYRGLPRLTRLTIQYEIAASIPLGVVFGVTGNAFGGLIAHKILGMGEIMFPLFMGLCMSGMLLALPLSAFFSSFRKTKVIVNLLRAISILLIFVAFIPPDKGIITHISFLLLIIMVWICVSSFTTMRSSIWRLNYPVEYRGQITVYVYFFVTAFSSISLWAFGKAIDNGMPFGYVYAISGSMGFIVAWIYGKIRIRGENKLFKRNSHGQKVQVLAGMKMLKADKAFRNFMSWQMLNGMSTMIVEGGVLVLIFTEVFDVNMKDGAVSLGAIPLFLSGISAFFWAGLFDRTDIFFMRFIGAMGWGLSRAVLCVAIVMGSFELAVISRVLAGLAMGAGQLAWRLGHMHFASAEKDSLYMGAHVGLTGLRSILAPMIGIWIYSMTRNYYYGVYFIASTALILFGVSFVFLIMRKRYKASISNNL